MPAYPNDPAPTIATVLLPAERAHVEAAGTGCFRVVHRETLTEAFLTVRERPVDAVLVSVHRCDTTEAATVRKLLRAFPGLPTLALVSRHDAAVPATLLRLGASGIRDVVDVTQPAGWGHLRHMLAEPTTRPAARILGPLLERLRTAPRDARTFLEVLVRLAPHTPTARGLARRLGVRPSTLMSRFGRSGLPSIKRYLAAVRLLYAAQYFENTGLSIADVAYRLECSSPQSFGRHIRSVVGVTCSEFRRRFPFPIALERFLGVMIDPYLRAWTEFHPLVADTVAGVQVVPGPEVGRGAVGAAVSRP